MAKAKKTQQTKSNQSSWLINFSIEKFIPKKFQLPVMLITIFLLFLIFLSPLYFGGKTFFSGDIVSIESMKSYVEKDREGYTLWNPYLFGGIPAYAISTGYKWFNLNWVAVETIKNTFMIPFSNDYIKWSIYLIAMAYSMFFFFYNRYKDKLVSLFAAVAVGFSTGIIVFLYIGHVTKLTSLAFYPLIFLMLFNFQKRIRAFDFFLMIILMNLFVLGWHVQVIFYTLFAIGIYFVFFFIHALLKKDSFLRNQIIKSALLFTFASLFAVAIQSDNLTQIYEYSPSSTRGTKSVLEEGKAGSVQSESDFYQYATNWSFSPGEVLTFIIPSYYGFGKSTYQGPLSNNEPVEVNTYFGQMPFVDVAQYMGVIVFFLALFSMVVNWKDPIVKYLTILSIFALLVSFGRTFPFVYDFMFHYFPFFDKFRVPSMILILVQMSFPVLAGLGLISIIKSREEANKKLQTILFYSFIGMTILLVISVLLESPIKEWFINRINESGQKGSQLKAIHDYMADMFITDFRFAFLFSSAAFGIAYAYTKNILSKDILVASIIFLTVIDLFRINHRGETFVENSYLQQMFSKPEYIQVIENQKDDSIYRLVNLKQDGSMGSFNQNAGFNAYFYQYDIHGYSGIKPRSYQDYMDVLGSPANPTFWRMLNIKYVVLDNQVNMAGLELLNAGEKSAVYRFTDVLPRAYFVNRVEKKSGLEILNLVKNNQFDPKEIAFTEEEVLNIDVPDSTASVSIAEFKEAEVVLNVNASGNNFLFLGDTYLPYGWNATIDDEETKIYKANHGFRGVVVPKGEHTVKFVYEPKSWVISKYVALSLSSLTILGLILTGFIARRKKS